MELNDLYLEFLFIVPIFEENEEEHKRMALFNQTSFQKNILSFTSSSYFVNISFTKKYLKPVKGKT